MEFVWILLFLSCLLLFLVYIILSSQIRERRQGIDPNGIVAYKNNNSTEHNHYLGVFTGLKWQCVEYARRWLIINKGVTFESIPDASDIWTLDTVSLLSTGERIPFHSSSSGIPPVGALLIYKKSEVLPHGHVSVVVGVTEYEVQLAEQNWTGDEWQSNYARTLPIQEGTIMNQDLLGWKYI